MTDFKLFGREPALWLSLISSLVMFTSAFLLDLSVEQQALLNAASVALFGLITAFSVARDGLMAAILGFAKAVIALAVGFGLNLGADKQSIIMVALTSLVSMFVRTQATAKIGPDGEKRTETSL